ncbi:YncE family protein [Paractinoplanes atraurantiacus]|uniref:Ig-like domain (Group 3) n=1 Tax=Paractinoplanes atraurantiacus TaxID=1036182 RepID=A0A285EXV7_9ACTN|nr:hypothetical protein [Actinoplanes atraurantiacus]SNY03849.1 hypothetical protein SAMN05421748_10151 [Actinoplanes atraurantiacus]
MRKLRAALTAATVLGTAAVAVAVGTLDASASTELGGGALLPISTASDVAVDTARQRLLISDENTGQLLRTTYAGKVETTKTALPGIRGLALSADGQTLYAAVAEAHAIVALNPATLAETGRYPLGATVYPRTLALVAGRVWFGYDGSADNDYTGNFGSLDVAGGSPALHDATADRTSFHDAPQLLTAPGTPGTLVVADVSNNAMTSGAVAVYDVSGAKETLKVKSSSSDTFVRDTAVTADGASLIGFGVGCPIWKAPIASPYARITAYDNKICTPSSIDVNTDGRVAIGYNNSDGSTDVALYPAGTETAEQEFQLPNTAPENKPIPDQTGKVAWEPGGKRVFALGYNYKAEWRLWVLDGPEQTVPTTAPPVTRVSPSLTIGPTGTVSAYGTTATVTARLGAATTNRVVEIWADPYGTEPARLLRKTTVDAKGVLTATLKLTRTTAVQVKFAGDAKYLPATASAVLNTRVAIALQPSRQYKAAKIGTVPYRYYRKTVHPYFVTTMTPYPNRKQRLIFEVVSGGAWKTWRVLDLPLTSAGTSTFTLTGTHPVGARYRVRAVYLTGTSGDSVNYTTYGAYQYFTFTA